MRVLWELKRHATRALSVSRGAWYNRPNDGQHRFRTAGRRTL
jgi:hypothetical protein